MGLLGYYYDLIVLNNKYATAPESKTDNRDETRLPRYKQVLRMQTPAPSVEILNTALNTVNEFIQEKDLINFRLTSSAQLNYQRKEQSMVRSMEEIVRFEQVDWSLLSAEWCF